MVSDGCPEVWRDFAYKTTADALASSRAPAPQKGVGGPRTGIVAGGHGNGRPGRARVIATTSRSRTEAFRVDYVRMAAAQPTPEQGIDLDGGRLGVRQSVLCGLGLY
jgi:hypothetical protein